MPTIAWRRALGYQQVQFACAVSVLVTSFKELDPSQHLMRKKSSSEEPGDFDFVSMGAMMYCDAVL
jgi:hypothetical protein